MNIDTEIENVEKKIEKLKFELSVEEAVLNRLKSIGGKKKRKSRKSNGPPRKGSLAAYLQSVLEEANRALTVNQLTERVQQKGYVNKAKVKLNNLVPSAMIRRDDIFIRVSHGLYDLKNRKDKGDGIISE